MLDYYRINSACLWKNSGTQRLRFFNYLPKAYEILKFYFSVISCDELYITGAITLSARLTKLSLKIDILLVEQNPQLSLRLHRKLRAPLITDCKYFLCFLVCLSFIYSVTVDRYVWFVGHQREMWSMLVLILWSKTMLVQPRHSRYGH